MRDDTARRYMLRREAGAAVGEAACVRWESEGRGRCEERDTHSDRETQRDGHTQRETALGLSTLVSTP